MNDWKITHDVDDETLMELLKLDKHVFAAKEVGDFDCCKKWLSVNNQIYTVLKYKDEVVGYINFTPLTDKAFQDYLNGKLKDYQLTEKHITPFRPGDQNCLFMSIAIKNEYRDGQAIVELINGFYAFLKKLKSKSINIRSALFDCVSVDGIKLAINIWGANFVRESKNGKLFIGLNEPHFTHHAKLRYEEIDENNLSLAAKIQYEIFKDTKSVGYLDYKNNLTPHDKLKNRILPLDYLVYLGETPIGIVGLYEMSEYKNDIFVDWLGVLPEYRNHGYGTQMLIHIFETARKYDKKYLRLYTFNKTYPQGVSLYKKIMQRSEDYTNPNDDAPWIKDAQCKVFSSALKDKEAPLWNNKFLNVKDEYTIHKKSIQALKSDHIISPAPNKKLR